MSLLAPADDRLRLAEYVGVFGDAFPAIESLHPGWDRTPWEREIRALYRNDHKLIRWSDGRRELYRVREDPLEANDRTASEPEIARAMEAALATLVGGLRPGDREGAAPEPLTPEQRERLRALGYLHDDGDGGRKP